MFKNRLTSVLFTAFFIFLLVGPGMAQGQREHHGQKAAALLPGARLLLEGEDTPFPAYVKFAEGREVSHATFFQWFGKQFQAEQALGFRLLTEKRDELGYIHYRYVQTFQGIPIDLATLHVQVREGKVVSFNGELHTPQPQSAKPGLNEKRALDFALDYLQAEHYLWENPFWEAHIKEHEGNPEATYYPQGELCWGRSREETDFRLAYRFDIYTEDHAGSQRVLVDATNGRVLNTFPLESNCSPSTVTDIYTGDTRNINTDKYTSDDFRLRDDCQSAVVRIRDWGSTTLTSSPQEIENTSNTWTTADERFGATVLWNTMECYDYFLDVHGRASYDNNNGNINGFVNAVFSCAPPSGCTTTNNASMSFSGGNMRVGRGNDGGGNPLPLDESWGTLDIIAHEYTHAVTGSSSELVYQGESGALNESFSDIFGDAVERNSTGTNDWLVGDARGGGGGAIRSLQNPKAFNDPDTYLGDNWVDTNSSSDNGGVHTNSGVQNYWFYLLAVGGSGTNDNGETYSVSGVGFNKARDIAYRNNVVKLTENSDYAAARTGAIDAAEDLYGVCSEEVIQVKNAWYAVGVGTPGMPAYTVFQIEENAACSEDNFSINLQDKRLANLVTPAYTWTTTYNGLTGGNGDCNGGCGTVIDETLTNPGGLTKTAAYLITPAYDGCAGPDFVVLKNVHARPEVSDYLESVLCSGDPFSIELQALVTNGVSANFSWIPDYNGLSGGAGDDYGDVIAEALNNHTQQTRTAEYSILPYGETGSCAGSVFQVSVKVPPRLLADAEAISDYNGYNISCHGGSDGVAEVFPTGGTPPFTYSWDDPNNQTTKVATGLMAATYTVEVTDANGCTGTASVTLNQPPPLSIDAGENQTVYYGYPPAECATLSWSEAMGGVPPYTFEWSTGETSQEIEVCPISTTTYTITITDLNGCTFTDEVTICVIDVRCGKDLKKVEICHQPPGNPGNIQTLCVAIPAVATHLANGSQLAACGTDHNCPPAMEMESMVKKPKVEKDLFVYPNPFVRTTNLSFTAASTGQARLIVLDFMGQRVATLFEGEVRVGLRYEAELEGSHLVPGLFYAVLQYSDGTILQKKLVLQR